MAQQSIEISDNEFGWCAIPSGDTTLYQVGLACRELELEVMIVKGKVALTKYDRSEPPTEEAIIEALFQN